MNTMNTIIISAMTHDRVIGQGDLMPWSVPAEYQQYLDFVRGNTVIMGRRTYETFGEDLSEDTPVVVVSRTATFDGAWVARSIDEAMERARSFGNTIFIAGGSSIYEQSLDIADWMYLSTIKGDFSGDAYFPRFDHNEWETVETRDEAGFVFRRFRKHKALGTSG